MCFNVKHASYSVGLVLPALTPSKMNCCRRLGSTVGDWRAGWSLGCHINTRTNFRPRPGAAASSYRSLASAAGEAASADTPEKPRLRAIDLARKVQGEKAKARTAEPQLTQSQTRTAELKRFTQQLQNVHPNVLAKHLHRSVLYRDQDVVVVNKPYGVPVKDDSGVTSISSVLPVLSKMIDGMKVNNGPLLLSCLGLEKETTGALLLARREVVLERLLHLHRSNAVQRKYWVVTVGVPVPSEGVIDIPVMEREVTGPRPHYKMALSPQYKMNEAGDGTIKVRAHRQAHPAVTRYQVLDSSSGCSLVELEPVTAVKHQMRVHMAFALACPILGDHKYSHWSKLAPQRVPERVLAKLRLEQSKSRHLPLHLLARQLSLPGTNGSEINVSCPLPKYFTQVLRQLQLTPPGNS